VLVLFSIYRFLNKKVSTMSQNNQSLSTEFQAFEDIPSSSNLPGDISELYVFGDLLSDTGNLFRITSEEFGEGFPPEPFFEGRYSNGSLWVENLAPEVGVPYNFNTNFALIGAPTGLDNVGNPFEANDVIEQLGLPGTLGQVNDFLASTINVDPNGLYTVWAGIYDLGLGITDPTEPVNNIVTAIENLANAGAKNILVPNLPDLDRFPGAENIPNVENQGGIIESWNSNLSRELDELEERLGSDVNLIELDTNSLFAQILSNPTQFGFTNATNPYIFTSSDGSNIRYDQTNPEADPNDYVFFGGTVPGVPAQPSAATHEIISEAVLSALASEGIDASEQFGTVEQDTIFGTNSSDNIIGLAGNDEIEGQEGQDILLGSAGNDTLNGNTENDYLLGGSDNDILVGGLGDDILNGGANNNNLQGDDGQDIFVINFNGVNTIEDFQDSRDQIDLAGSLTFSDLNIAQQGNDTAIGFGETQLAILSGVEASSLSVDDFTAMT
jgi:phospholipase/lecithinase/hemolysin